MKATRRLIINTVQACFVYNRCTLQVRWHKNLCLEEVLRTLLAWGLSIPGLGSRVARTGPPAFVLACLEHRKR